jgi:hypothetical protein
VDIQPSDIDNDSMVYSYLWTDPNGTIQQTTTQASALSDVFLAAGTFEGDWTCEVTPNDGTDDGTASIAITTVEDGCPLVGNGAESTCPSTSCLDILNDGYDMGDGTYWIDPDGSGAFEVHCDMSTDGGGWTMVSNISDTGSDVWSQFMPAQDTGLWDSTATLGSLDFFSDYKSEAYLTLDSSDILIKENQSNVLYANSCWSLQSFHSFISNLNWNSDGSDSNWSDSTGAYLCSFEHFGYNDSVLRAGMHSGSERIVAFKWGERDGVQDGNKDRTMITTYRANNSLHHVDLPTGLGGFTSYGSSEHYEDANECQGDGPDQCSNSSQNYQILVR